MRLLHVDAIGFPLFKSGLRFSLIAQQRVASDDKDRLYNLIKGSPFYLNSVTSVIGINASGKTSVLKVLLLALDILNNEPISHCESKDILGEASDAELVITFFSDSEELCQLETHLQVVRKGNERQYRITSETLKKKAMKEVKTKAQLIDFSEVEPFMTRLDDENFLADDISIIIAYNKKNYYHPCVKSLLSMTDVNVLPVSDDISLDVVQYLDPTIEALFFDREDRKTIHLKFVNQDEILLSDSRVLNRFLSSGTIKGIVAFSYGIQVLRAGGYLIIDELENHFNKEITATLIRLFLNTSININGGTLIFSTHYPELLDEFDRNDCIFITKNQNGITMDVLSNLLKRNDVKKSEAYQSDMLTGTAPSYEAYMRLKHNLVSSLNKRSSDD
ncbi:MAG: ATP-binding protein [Spirochaetales bacterium]|nr:ATP-binding protein [Spirochaetales bacterium]